MDNVLVKFLPFECRLTLVTRRRLSPLNSLRQWIGSADVEEQNRELLMLDFEALTRTLKTYFDDYMEIEFENSLYAPFNYVSLTGTDRRLLKEHGEVETDFETTNDMHITPVRSSNLRKRRVEVFNVSKRYDGVAVFSRDGDLQVPSSNFLQSKQLQAHADEYNTLLYMLRSSSPNTGLDNVASVTLSVDVNPGNRQGGQQAPAPATDFDFIIIVAVIVAGCSMILLAFALFLAFRRRSYAGARPMVQTKLSPRTETDRSPNSMQISSPPPVQVMEVRHELDDNISDYTESVFSLPKQTKQNKIKESLSSNIDNTKKHQKISSRFNPRYIISSKKSADGESENSRDDNTSIGLPHLASTERKAVGNRDMNANCKNSTQSKAEDTDNDRTGLYPADLIDDDITSSLSAYGRGMGLPNIQRNNDDGVSLSSAESYGFSLDGVGDQSTFAASTKYGY